MLELLKLGALFAVTGVALRRWDVAGAGIALLGMAVIALQPHAQ